MTAHYATNLGADSARWRALAVVLSVMFIGGCFFLANGPEPGIQREVSSGLKFDHKAHNEDYEVGDKCERCHDTFATADVAGMPNHGTCGIEDCHGDDVDKGGEKANCGLCHTDPGHQVVRTVRPGFQDVLEAHAAHANAKVPVACEECHPGAKDWNPVGVIGMEDCQDCHKKRELTDATWNCSACHAVIREDYRPASHHKRFVYDHGDAAEGFAEDEDTRCMACHEESACNECHEEMPPRDHNNHWRRRGHGLHAMGDRERCGVCHRSDMCDDCHRTCTPRSHRGATWSSGRNRHCIRCHEDIRDSACQVCHAAGEAYAAHNAAPPYPKDALHGSVTGCSMACHRVGGLTPHMDAAIDCIRCHK